MGAKNILHAIDEHKKKLSGPHFIFSAENPSHKPELKMSHEQVLHHLRAAGYDSHGVEGHYGSPERSIITYGVNHEQVEGLHKLAARLGQHSSLHSDGKNHELRFHQGSAKGKRIRGSGTDWHDAKPTDNFTSLPGGIHHFAHKFGPEDDELDKSEANTDVQGVADQYAKGKGLTLTHGNKAKVNPEFSTKVANEYMNMKHDPQNPEVKSAYGALIGETHDQFNALQGAGYKFSRIKPGQDNPYKTSKDLHDDIRNNKHMWFYPTSSGFGSDNAAPTDHPMLAPTGVHHDGQELLANDMFRIVHDYMGHGKGGHTFGANGEESAYQDHSQMYSPLARRALTTETRGQNSVVNFGPHAAHNKANPAKTIFADQKAGLMPEWTGGNPHAPIQKSENGNDYSFKVKNHKDQSGVSIEAHHRGKRVGGASFTHGKEGLREAGFESTDSDYPTPGEMVPLHVEVEKDHRRKGLASKMYELAERSTGKKVRRGPQKTADSDAFWAQPNRKFGKAETQALLNKTQADDDYKKFASQGMALMYPVKIKGQTHNPKTGIGYHNTIKVFNRDTDSIDQAHDIASQTPLRPPSAKHATVEPITLTGHTGHTIYALALHGVHEHEAKEHNARFGHMGYKQNYDFKSHISVDQDTWNRIRDEKPKSAHEAGIEFGHAELRQGNKVLARYPFKHRPATSDAIQEVRDKIKDDDLGKSEPLEKGLMRVLGAGATAAALAVTPARANVAPIDQHPKSGSHEIETPSTYDHGKMLHAIEMVESSGGKNLKHHPTSNGTAFGRYALMPNTIRDIIHLDEKLSAEHKKAVALDDSTLVRYLGDHPGLEQQLADSHLNRLEQHFGKNPEKLGFAWNQGIHGANKAIKEKKDIADHPYVAKIREAYKGV